MLPSVVGPADVSIDQSTLTGQRSRWVHGQRAPLVSLALRLTGGPLGSGRKRKKKKVSVWFWAESGDGPAQGPTARLGSRGQLGLRLSRPARAGGLSSRVGRPGGLGSLLAQRDLGLTPSWATVGLAALSSSSPPRWRLPPLSFSLTGRAQVSVSAGSGAAGLDPVR
jgi:hypothetical protein